jgi:hypothetical protein
MSESCAVTRCRQPSTVGVLPDGCQAARFICRAHWVKLTALDGSVCANIRGLLGLDSAKKTYTTLMENTK